HQPFGGAVMSTIAVEALTKRYRTVTAVDDLTSLLAPGRITGILGPHEAGTSTTIRVLHGLARPRSVRSTINGRHYAELPNPPRLMSSTRRPPGLTARAWHGCAACCAARSPRDGPSSSPATCSTS